MNLEATILERDLVDRHIQLFINSINSNMRPSYTESEIRLNSNHSYRELPKSIGAGDLRPRLALLQIKLLSSSMFVIAPPPT